MKKFFLIPFILVGCFFFSQTVLAHQPYLVKAGAMVEIQNPEVSQAFYSELKGEPQLFEIKTDRNILLYVGILVPDIANIKKNISAQIFSSGKGEIALLNGEIIKWPQFYEEYAGDSYWQGPEYKKEVVSGTYQIKVSSPDNLGKYVLVVGEKESFTPIEMLKTIFTLPKLKIFFNKSPLTAFFNLIGLYLMIVLVIVVLLSGLIILIIKKRRKRKKKNK